MHIARNIELRPLLKLGDSDGWETSAAQAFKTVFYTANYFACYSNDLLQTCRKVSPYSLATSVGHKFCCDQNVIYIPAANTFVWTILADDGPVLMALASPDEIVKSKGLNWTIYDLSAAVFDRPDGTEFDYPQTSFGDNFLYLTFNIIGTADAIACRFAIGQLRERGTLNFQYFAATNNSYICPSQLSGGTGFFATQNTTSEIRVFAWRETSNTIDIHDIKIPTIPTEDFSTPLPDGNEWLVPLSKINTAVTGCARSGPQLWVAWSGARRVLDKRENTFSNPHIGIAVISVQSFKLMSQKYLWNDDFAFAYPSLASNPAGDVAITFMYGGQKYFVRHGVGILTGQSEFTATNVANTNISGGGHFITVRMVFPEVDSFVAAGYTVSADPTLANPRDEPRYVMFSR